jgi:hypothetical protein
MAEGGTDTPFWTSAVGAGANTIKWVPPEILKLTLRMASCGMLRRVAGVRTDVSEELSASFIRVTRIGELGTTQAATSNRRTLRRLLVTATFLVHRFLSP